jgi:hypothetical protein
MPTNSAATEMPYTARSTSGLGPFIEKSLPLATDTCNNMPRVLQQIYSACHRSTVVIWWPTTASESDDGGGNDADAHRPIP